MDAIQSNWHFEDVKNWKALNGKGLAKYTELLCNLIWGDIEFLTDLSNVTYWKKPGNPQMWTVNSDDIKWFIANILKGGSLNLEIRGPKGHGWRDWQTDYNHWAAILQKDLAMEQKKKRGPKGLFLKAKKTRIKNPNWLSLRVPHR